MSFLYASMLAGLAALAVPTILHLIAKQRFQVVDLPTIRLLDRQKRSNTLARRLVDRWQLLLRLLLLLLAVLAMARWYAAWSPGPGAPRNVVLVVDTSASMRMRQAEGAAIELARANALAVLDGLAPGSRCGLVADGPAGAADVAPTTDLAAVRSALASLSTIDGTGRGLVRSVADACALLHGRRAVASQVVVFSDLRAGAFAARDRLAMERIAAASADLGPALDLAFVDAGAPADNTGVVDAYFRGGDAKVGEDAHLIATLVSAGDEPHEAALRLSVAERRDPKVRKVALAPHARTVVDLTTRVNRSTQTLARVEIEADGYADDDSRAVPLNVRDVRRVLIVDGIERVPAASGSNAASAAGPVAAPAAHALDGATILRFALNPGRELGLPYGTGFETTTVTSDALAAQPLSSFEMVVLYDVSTLPERVIGDLRTFVGQGRALLIVASAGTSAVSFNRTLAAGSGTEPALAPAQIGNDQELEPAVGIALDGGDRGLLAPFLDPAQGDLSVVRLLALREVRDAPPGTSVLLRTTDGRPIAVQSSLGTGRVAMFATGFELARGNLARTRVFPALLWRLADHLTGRTVTRPPDSIQAMQPAVLDVSEPALSLVERLELTVAAAPQAAANDGSASAPAPAPAIPLEPAVESSVRVPPLAAGAYTLHRARAANEVGQLLGYQRYIVAHTDAAESDMSRLPPDGLGPLFGDAARRIPTSALADLAPRGGELTLPLLVLLAALYAVESLTGWITGRRRERAAAEAGDA